ncbi:uncharacterized protein LOC143891936 [Tasmannia lanceolata]|uniref:uncharacterized protein LOC143891936 n=1 Tax=Tasmannia lanceolata TaxID=3420 RepID=UPI0040632D83
MFNSSTLAGIKHLGELWRNEIWHIILDNDSLKVEKEILSRSLFIKADKNRAIWMPTVDGRLTIKSAWEAIRQSSPIVPWAKAYWFKGHIPKHAIVVWKVFQNKLLTKDKMQNIFPSIISRCILCSAHQESINHLFLNCGYTSWIWRSILRRFNTRRRPFRSLQEEENWVRLNWTGMRQAATAMKLALSSTIYRIWKERNERQFQNVKCHKSVILKAILQDVKERINWLQLHDRDNPLSVSIASHFGYMLNIKINRERFCSWTPPLDGEYKLNTYASLESNEGGLGGVIRNDRGMLISLFSVNCSME